MASTIGPLEGASAHHLRHGTLDGCDERVDTDRPSPHCPSECHGCDPVPDPKANPASKRPLQGGPFVVASICTFLLPLAAALAGAVLAADSALQQLIGAGGGLLAAATLVALITGSLGRHASEGP